MTHRVSAASLRRVAIAACAAGLLAACGGSSNPSPPLPSSSAVQRPGLKPVIHGLVYLQGTPPASLRAPLAAYDVQGPGDYGAVSWAELQPQKGGPIAPGNPIDQAISEVRAWNASHPQQHEVLKVRIQAGIHSPQWAMSLGGPCVEIHDPNFNVQGCTPRFWTQDFAAAFYQFEAELAARYDDVPEIAEVVIARNMTVYNEPLLRQINDPTTVANLVAAGYTTSLDEANQRSDIAALGRYWKHTRVGFTFNPYQTVNPNGADESFTEQLMSYGRSVLGDQLVLENDSLRSSFLSGSNASYQRMYAHMKDLGPPLAFQTAVLARVGDLTSTIDGAQQLGASEVELPPGYQSQLSNGSVASLARALPAAA